MTMEQFVEALDRHGGSLEGWPPAERAQAEALLAVSPEAARLLAEAGRVEAFIRANDPAGALGPDALVRLTNTVMVRLPARRAPLRRRLLERLGLHGPRLEWAPRFAMSMAVAAMLGVAAGQHMTGAATQQLSPAELLAMSNSYLPLDVR